jgi:hypothetical protein
MSRIEEWMNLKFKDNIQILLSLSIMILIIIITLIVLFDPSNPNANRVNFFISILAVALGVLSIWSTFQQHPSLILISIIGLPQSGKTVFLSVLFDLLKSKKIDGITYSAYGTETLEEGRSNLILLKSNKGLRQTAISYVFPFRAIASLKSGLNRKKFKIEIDDYSGEFSQEISDVELIRKSEFFHYVEKSNILFIAIDGDIILNSIINYDPSQTNSIENLYIGALELIREEKDIPLDKKMKTPVAIIFMKCDLFYPYFKSIEDLAINGNSVTKWEPKHKAILTQSIQRLIDYCDRNLSNHQIFFTSAVGNLDENYPPSVLNPENITEPISWAMHYFK